MDIERLRALEKDIRNSGGPGCQYHADQLASIIAELGQEVGAVADSELPGMWSASDFTGGDPDERCYSQRNAAVGEVIVYDSYRGATLYEAEHCTLPAGTKLYTSPAHTSEARDSERLDWVINHPGQVVTKWGHESSWHVVGAITGRIISRGHASYREAIDAVMRQEGGTP